MIKVLTTDNWPEIESAVKKLPFHRVAQTRQTIPVEEFLRYTQNILKRANSTVYGYYENEELTSMISLVEFSQMPAYVIYNWRNLKPSNVYNPVKNGWSDLWNRLIEDQEKKGNYTFYMMRTTDVNRLQYKKFHNMYMKHSPKFLNYERTVEEVVPANSKTKWAFFDSILYFNKTFDYETMVLKFTCRQEHRNNVTADLQAGLTLKYEND